MLFACRIFARHKIALMLLFATLGFADIGPRGFIDFRNAHFVETGTCRGGSILTALRTGFRTIDSIECDPDFFEYSRDLFDSRRYSHVKVHFGDSRKLLWEVIKDKEEPITFWLDAHRFPPLDDGVKNCPLLAELEQIKRHPIKTHTILIDDIRCCGKAEFDYLTLDELISKIREINPDYQIYRIDGGEKGEARENVLAAQIEKGKR